jgi:hypothetical protein
MNRKQLDRSYLEEQDEPLGFISGAFILLAMIAVSVMIADVATGFSLHEVIGGFIN